MRMEFILLPFALYGCTDESDEELRLAGGISSMVRCAVFVRYIVRSNIKGYSQNRGNFEATARGALLDESAAALATVSAMALSGAEKIYRTSKLFALDRHQPAGIMICSDGEFMEAPWERRPEIGRIVRIHCALFSG